MRIGYLVVDHGSRRDAANRQLEAVAAALRARRPGDLVRHAHMELAAPDIAAAVADLVAAGATEIRVLPYFLADGRHLGEDIPALVAEALAGHEGIGYRIGAALGPDAALADLLLRRIGEEP